MGGRRAPTAQRGRGGMASPPATTNLHFPGSLPPLTSPRPAVHQFSSVVSLTSFHTPTCWVVICVNQSPPSWFSLNLKVLAPGPPATGGKWIWLGEQLPSTQIAFLACIFPPLWPVTWNTLVLDQVWLRWLHLFFLPH